MTTPSAWPELPYEAWKDTCATLHLWTQVVGKIALALAPPLNHCWGVALHLTARGLSTRVLPHGERSFSLQFDFIAHQLVIIASDGARRTLALAPRSVADFHRALMDALAGMGLPVTIWPVAVELPEPIRLDQDTIHHTYDPEQAHRFWQVLLKIERVFSASRCDFVGKCSPVNFFWGSFDLAVTRFSGRRAPAQDGPGFQRDAYSHEVISHGFWPGSDALPEPAFYAYAVPPPEGLAQAGIQPGAAYFHRELGEFILPYEAVRTSPSPERTLGQFIDSTYAAAADLAGWDRDALARPAPGTTE